MDLGIARRWALICGASKGLGFGCAKALVENGVNVVINARTPEGLNKATNELKRVAGVRAEHNAYCPTVIAAAGDITLKQGRTVVFNAAGGPGFDFDIVVTNAGGPPPGDFRDWNRTDWVNAIDANMLTPIELIKATIDGMGSRGFGRIVNITSSAVKAPIAYLGLSNGARSGLSGFTAGLARSETAGRGVTINNLLPGKFATDRLIGTMTAVAKKSGKSLDEVAQEQAQMVPAKRFGTAEEFGALCAFLCSQHAAYITGQNILIDGGMYPGTF